MADEGAVTVCVRVRPLIERENAELSVKEVISWKSEKCNISQVDGTKSFTFDRVFHAEESTAEVYNEVADPIIKSAVRGYNGTIFAYGQTASGKTYTMLGTKNSPGILPMAIEDVFKTICAIPDREFLLRISYMEIHNETIKDLLCDSIRKKKPLIVREDIGRNIYVEDLIEEVVVSPEQVMSWLQKGEKNRHYGETKMNARSSRSHTIFRMIIESKEKTDSSSSNCDGAVMVSHLNLVDLAGSERASQTGTEGIRLKEGCNINRSLFILGQVIKKLCDDQSGGFINYRDSKLTRILQNSLGGNAKTAIICTVTPVSLEETLSTLQFASTAKEMKNSPKVNEVLDDDALLKRYRREIEDLKRRLEEVSSDCHTRNEEKDQLAQLLEEKNSLQKQQQDRIRTLAEMVVTSSSFLQEQELKARKKRRVTWAPGQLSHNREIFSDFPQTAKRFKASSLALPEMEESVSSVFSEYDDQCLAISASIPDEEWIPGPEMSLTHKDFADSVHLCETLAAERDSAVTKQQATQAELEFLQLEKEQLSHEVKDLTEKIEINEFVVLEKETHKEYEMQLMHEMSNLKAVIANAEGYNQDLQDDLKSKELQLKEKQNKITTLEKQITELNNLLEESRKTGGGNIEVSLAGTSSQMDEMKRSLSDAEIVAIDAKKESAFLQSENRALKERMDQLLDDYNHIKKDAESYKSQLEAGKVTYKKMQSDLQKELQYYFQENAKLTSLLQGKVPEDNQSPVELHEKIVHLKNELNNTLEENISLRKEVAALSETGPKPDLEILHKEILEKSETIISLTSERETLLSQLAEKEQMLLQMVDTLKAKEDFANAEAVRKNNEVVQELKHQCQELERELSTVSEENTQIKDQIEKLSDENLKLNAAISEILQELSSKVEELQAKDLEQEKFLCMEEQLNHARQELSHMEQQLKDQLKAYESKVEAGEVERLALVQRLQGRGEEISALAQERDDLKQMLEALQKERDQIKDDIEETVAMNIEAQNELRSSQTSLKQCQKDIKELQATVLEKESQIASLKETSETTINKQKLQILRLTEDLEQAILEKNQLSARGDALKENNELQLMREQIFCLEEEKTKLQQQLEAIQAGKALSPENPQLLTIHMKDSQATGMQEEELIGMKEELGKTLQKQSEMEEQLRASESRMEAAEMTMAQELCKHEEVVRSLVQERENLRRERDTLQLEKDQVPEEMRVIQSVHSNKTQELQDQEKEQEESLQMEEQHSGEAQQNKSENDRLKDLESVLEVKEMEIREMAERLQRGEEERKSLALERDALKHKWEGLQVEKETLKEPLEVTTAGLANNIQEMQAKTTQEEELLIVQEKLGQALQKLTEMEELREQLKASECRMEADRTAAAQELREHEEAVRTLVQERDDLRHKQAALQLERDQVQEEMRATQSTLSSKIQELEVEAKELLQVKEQLCGETQQNQREMEQLTQQLRALESTLEAKEREKSEMAERLQGGEEERKSLVLERDELKQRWAALQTEKEKLKERLEETTSKLSIKTQELQDQEKEREVSVQIEERHSGEAQQNKSEVDRLKDLESVLEAKQVEIRETAERLQRSEEERKSLVLERDELKHKWDAVEAEKDQLKELLEETTAKLTNNIQELQAKNTQEEELLIVQEKLGQALQKLSEMEELREQLKASECRMEADRTAAAQELREHEEAVRTLVQERDDLRHKQAALQLERDQVQEEMRATQSTLSSKIQELEVEAKELLQVKEQLCGETQQNQREMEQLTQQLRALESTLEAKEREKSEMAERLQGGEEERKSLVLERDELKQRWAALQTEKEKLKERLEETTSKLSIKTQELQDQEKEREVSVQIEERHSGEAQQNKSEVDRLKDLESVLEAKQVEIRETAERLQRSEEERKSLVLERDAWKHKWDAVETEKDQLKELLEETTAKLTNNIQELQAKNAQEEELLIVQEKLGQALQKLSEMEELREQLKASECRMEADRTAAAQELREHEEAVRTLVQEREDLRHKQAALQLERDQVQEEMRATQSTLSSKIQELEVEAKELLQVKEQLCGETQQNQQEMEQLTQQLRALESTLEAKEREKLEMAERLQGGEEERKSLVLERDELKQRWAALQTEKEKLKELLEETTSKLTNNIQELQAKTTQEEELLIVQEKLGQALQKLTEMEELREQLKASECRMEADRTAAAQELREHEEAVRTLVQERDDLRHKQAALQLERDQVQEELRATQSTLSSKIQELQVEAKELFQVKEQLCGEAQQNQREMEQLTQQLRALESTLEAKEREKSEMAERLQGGEEERKSLVLERDELKQRWAALQTEKEKLKERLEETTSKALELQEELENANGSLKEYHNTVEELRGENSQASRMQENLHQNIEDLKQKVLDTQAEVEKLLEKTKCQERQIARQESLIIEQEEQLRKREAELENEMTLLNKQLEELTEKLTSQIAENNHLLAKWKAEAESVQKLGMENSMLKKERDNIKQAVENTKAENNQLRSNLLENTEKFSKTNAKLEQDLHELKQQLEKDAQEKMPENKEQDNLEMLQAKVSKITEALQKLPMIEKRSEYFGRIALNLSIEVNNQKALVAKGLEEVSREKGKQIRKLQMEHELVSNSLRRLLNKVQFFFTRLCKKKGEYYVNVSNYTMEMLDERRKQHELLIQIQSLNPCQNPHAAISQQLCIPELSQNLDLYGKQIWDDVSQMEEEVHSVEVMLQQLEMDGRRANECSVPFDVQDFEIKIKQDSERMFPVGRFLKPKAQVLIDAKEEVEARKANYCTEAEAALKTCRERTKELLQELNTLKERQVPSGHASHILEEENYRLDCKLKAHDQDMQGLKLKIQELENAANEARKNLLEKEKRIAVLEMELKVRASRSEVVRLRASLEEKENCLTSTVMENQTLKAQLNKGAQLYKEEIEDLKTQLAKADMAMTKQSKCFDREMANAKALAEHRAEQLRKLREELRQTQQDQDVTVISSKDISQPSLPITCGGGSGIVQNTQLLMLQCERAKMERELGQLKKEHELLLKNELLLKEEVKKWKDRALKLKEQSRDISEEPRLKSPRKTAPPSLAGLSSSPSSRTILPLDTPPVQLNCPTTFFDNSSLGTFNDVRLAGGESTEAAPSENSLKRRIARTNKDSAPECKTQ